MATADVTFVDLDPGDPRLTEDALAVLRELRPHLDAAMLAAVHAEGHPQGLRFTAVYEGGTCVAVAGWRLMATTNAVRKLYVDDLVTASERRSRGCGRALLAHLTDRARAAGCAAIDLDSNVARQGAHRFYLREHMPIVAFHFSRALD